jgi:hypothetical protein
MNNSSNDDENTAINSSYQNQNAANVSNSSTSEPIGASSRRMRRPRVGQHLLSSQGGMQFRMPSNQDTHDHALNRHGEHSWRYQTIRWIHSSPVQIALMSLLFCDVLILFVELLFLAQFPHCSIIQRDAISCCPATANTAAATTSSSSAVMESIAGAYNSTGDYQHRRTTLDQQFTNSDYAYPPRFLTESSAFCPSNWSAHPSFPATCNPNKWHAVHSVENMLFAVTICILTIFLTELTASMLALTPSVFFRQFFFVLDFVIILVSLVLELTFHIVGDDAIYEYVAGILIVGRIWRFVRIGHGIMEITNEMAHREYSDLLAYAEELQDRLRRQNIAYPPMTEYVKHKADEPKDSILSEIERNHRAKLRHEYSEDDNQMGKEDEERQGQD